MPALFQQKSSANWLHVIVAILLLALSACASSPDDDDDKSKWSAEKLLSEAKEALAAEDYEIAIETYETLEAKYPFGRYAEQGMLDTAYAYYKFEELDTAIASAERFIKLHPRHKNVDYAYYIRGLASNSKNDNPMNFIEKQDPSMRDPSSTQKSYNYYAELIRKFPQSRYAADALHRMGHLRNDLAMHEIHVAHYYIKRGAYVAAANRAKHVISNFPRTPASRIALQILVDAYKELHLNDLAADAQRVLDLNTVDQKQAGTKKPAADS